MPFTIMPATNGYATNGETSKQARPTQPTWGWAGSFSDFLATPDDTIVSDLTKHHQLCMAAPPSSAQLVAWLDELRILRDQLPTLPRGENHWIAFEYELPRERGRRPDVLLLFDEHVVVVEFKSGALPLDA